MTLLLTPDLAAEWADYEARNARAPLDPARQAAEFLEFIPPQWRRDALLLTERATA